MCAVHLILFDLIVLIIFGRDYKLCPVIKLWIGHLRNHLCVTYKVVTISTVFFLKETAKILLLYNIQFKYEWNVLLYMWYRKDPEQESWRRSWGNRDENKDEFWAALQSNYNYLMDNNLIESCKVKYLKQFESSGENHRYNIQSESKYQYCLYHRCVR
jgi:hypothetical protein